MGGLAQKVKNLFIRNEELLPMKDDDKFHSSIQQEQNQNNSLNSEIFNQVQSSNENLNNGKLQMIDTKLKELEQELNYPVRMITMMQGKQYNTQIYQYQQNKIGEIISKLN